MKKIEAIKTRLIAKKIFPPFLDWQESYADLLKFEETSNHHQWLNNDIDFYFFTQAGSDDFFDEPAWIARSAFGPELGREEEIFTYDLSPGEALRYEIPLSFWDFRWEGLHEHYHLAQKKLKEAGFLGQLSSTWRLKLIASEKIVMEFFTDNGQ